MSEEERAVVTSVEEGTPPSNPNLVSRDITNFALVSHFEVIHLPEPHNPRSTRGELKAIASAGQHVILDCNGQKASRKNARCHIYGRAGFPTALLRPNAKSTCRLVRICTDGSK